jgi:hypothetical protein
MTERFEPDSKLSVASNGQLVKLNWQIFWTEEGIQLDDSDEHF